MILRCRTLRLDLARKTRLMGIINVTDDSFSGDGLLATGEDLVHKVRQLRRDGMDIADIGGESARTNRGPISEQEEIDRICPAVTDLAALFPDMPLSANTWRPRVVEAALQAGAHLINDIGGLPDDANARLASKYGAALVIMHTEGEPKVPHRQVTYADAIDEVLAFFERKIALAQKAGLSQDQLLLDPGLDFAKQREDNLRLMRELPALRRFGCAILLAPSRKTVIGEVLGCAPAERDAGTAALCTLGILGGARLLRVHNVKAMAAVAGMTDAILGSSNAAAIAPPQTGD